MLTIKIKKYKSGSKEYAPYPFWVCTIADNGLNISRRVNNKKELIKFLKKELVLV